MRLYLLWEGFDDDLVCTFVGVDHETFARMIDAARIKKSLWCSYRVITGLSV
jgi:hypothetical protein